MKYLITHIDPILVNDFPKDFFLNQKGSITSAFKFKFRLLDSDKNIYFKGVSTGNNSFCPLDFLGIEFGCTDIQYFEKGKYVSL